MNKVSYVRKEDVLDLIDEIQKETDTFSLIQLAFLKERINNKLMEFDERFILRSKVIDKLQDEFRLLVHDYNFLKPCLDQQELIDRYNYLIYYIIDRIYEESNKEAEPKTVTHFNELFKKQEYIDLLKKHGLTVEKFNELRVDFNKLYKRDKNETD